MALEDSQRVKAQQQREEALWAAQQQNAEHSATRARLQELELKGHEDAATIEGLRRDVQRAKVKCCIRNDVCFGFVLVQKVHPLWCLAVGPSSGGFDPEIAAPQ